MKTENEIIEIINKEHENIDNLCAKNASDDLKEALGYAMGKLNNGELRIAVRHSPGKWETIEWLKKAVILYFVSAEKEVIPAGYTNYYDGIPLKYKDAKTPEDFKNVRVMPPGNVRYGAYIGEDVILMPSYVNIGAYVGFGTLVDTWATVGTCAQVGNNVHLSGGVGLGGVFEPAQASPTIIEDNCFIGARSEVVEGVVIGEGSVLAMGTFISKSTKIYDRHTGEITYGYVPPYSVVVPGSLPSDDGKYNMNCAIIVKKCDKQTREKTAINDLLRHH